MTKHLASILVALSILLSACGSLTDDGLLFATADPKLSIGFRLLPPPPGATVQPQVAPDPTAIAIEEEEASQVACDIKANVGSSGNIYHMPGGVYYDRVKVDTSQGDFYACSEQEAIDAGFRKAQR